MAALNSKVFKRFEGANRFAIRNQGDGEELEVSKMK